MAQLAAQFGISPLLARRRLIDAVLAPPQSTADPDTLAREAPSDKNAKPVPGELIAQLDDGQRVAARASGPALVVAGPGTGKTATLVGRVAHLVEERHIPPEQVLALTFSNRAAGETRERLERSGLPGERMPIMTIHAFAATLLRDYPSRVPHAPDEAELTADFRILDEANAYLLMEGLLGELPLHYYRSLGNPTGRLRALLDDFSHARDELLTPKDYQALVDAMKRMPAPDELAAIESPGSAKKEQGKQARLDEKAKKLEQEISLTNEDLENMYDKDLLDKVDAVINNNKPIGDAELDHLIAAFKMQKRKQRQERSMKLKGQSDPKTVVMANQNPKSNNENWVLGHRIEKLL